MRDLGSLISISIYLMSKLNVQRCVPHSSSTISTKGSNITHDYAYLQTNDFRLMNKQYMFTSANVSNFQGPSRMPRR